jgi:hypothetical protein
MKQTYTDINECTDNLHVHRKGKYYNILEQFPLLENAKLKLRLNNTMLWCHPEVQSGRMEIHNILSYSQPAAPCQAQTKRTHTHVHTLQDNTAETANYPYNGIQQKFIISSL